MQFKKKESAISLRKKKKKRKNPTTKLFGCNFLNSLLENVSHTEPLRRKSGKDIWMHWHTGGHLLNITPVAETMRKN